MSLDDRGLPNERYVDLTCGTENLSPYSNNAGYTDPPSYYQADYNWQHAQQPHQALPHQTQLRESDRHYYPGFADESNTSTHTYITYAHQSESHANFYPQTSSLWPTDNSGDHLTQEQISQHPRFFSGIDLSQQSMVQSASNTPGASGKPKRKRVQSHSQRKAANVRERRRMFHLNEAFDELRKRLPAFNYEKRLSRIETLRLAMTYISFMKEVSIGRDPKCVKLKPHGADLSPLPHSNNGMLASPTYYTDKDNDSNSNVNEDSDACSDEMSNHSGEH